MTPGPNRRHPGPIRPRTCLTPRVRSTLFRCGTGQGDQTSFESISETSSDLGLPQSGGEASAPPSLPCHHASTKLPTPPDHVLRFIAQQKDAAERSSTSEIRPGEVDAQRKSTLLDTRLAAPRHSPLLGAASRRVKAHAVLEPGVVSAMTLRAIGGGSGAGRKSRSGYRRAPLESGSTRNRLLDRFSLRRRASMRSESWTSHRNCFSEIEPFM